MVLQRLHTILGALSIQLSTGIISPGNYVRNRNELPKEKVPGIILLDADEVRDPRFPERDGRGTINNYSLGLMKMTPEIYIVLDVRKPNNINVGTDLGIARAAILHAVLTDATLNTIVGSNGGITYDGCITDLARNRKMEGQMGISLTFTYPFIATELATA